MLEAYTLFSGLDKGALALNDLLSGYTFQIADLGTLEKDFGSLFGLPGSYNTTMSVTYGEHGVVSREFLRLFQNSDAGTFQDIGRGYVVLLRRNEATHTTPEALSQEVLSAAMPAFIELRQYVEHIIRCLRLTFSGEVPAPILFLKESDSGHVWIKLVHGSSSTVDQSDLDEAEELARTAIRFWMDRSCSRDELFRELNARGFPPLS